MSVPVPLAWTLDLLGAGRPGKSMNGDGDEKYRERDNGQVVVANEC